MSKFNKFIITFICSFLLISSLTIFNNKNIIKADTNRNQLVTLVATFITKLGIDFTVYGYQTSTEVIAAIEGLMYLYESQTGAPLIDLTDFTYDTTTKIVEYSQNAVNYCRNFTSWLKNYFSLNNSTTTSLVSNTGYYWNINGSLLPVCINYDYANSIPISTFTTNTPIGSTTYNLFTIGSDVYTYEINCDTSRNYTLIFYKNNSNLGRGVTLARDTFYQLFNTYNSTDGSRYYLYRDNTAVRIYPSFNFSTYGQSELVYLNQGINALSNNPAYYPAVNNYGALTLQNTNAITSLTDVIGQLDTAIKSNNLSDTALISFGETINAAIDNLTNSIGQQITILDDIKNIVDDILSFISDGIDLSEFAINVENSLKSLAHNFLNALNQINVNDSNFSVGSNIKQQLTALNSALFGGLLTSLYSNGLGIFIFMGLVLIIVSIIL